MFLIKPLDPIDIRTKTAESYQISSFVTDENDVILLSKSSFLVELFLKS